MSFAAYCEKGHQIGIVHQRPGNSGWRQYVERAHTPRVWPPYCSECGGDVFEWCPVCNSRIQPKAKFCPHCSNMFPWTEVALQAAREAVDEAEQLTPEEQTTLKETLPDLTVESPRTPLAVSRFSKLTAKAGPIASALLKDIVSPIVLAEVKKKLGLP